jgi:hypothetical protein
LRIYFSATICRTLGSHNPDWFCDIDEVFRVQNSLSAATQPPKKFAEITDDATGIPPADFGSLLMFREGQFCNVGATPLLNSLLTTHSIAGQVGSDGAVVVSRRRQPLGKENSFFNDMVRYWTGLHLAVESRLRSCEIGLIYSGGLHLPTLEVPRPDKSLPDMEILRFIACHDRGVIRYNPNSVDLPFLINQVARAWPRLRIAVIVSHRTDVINLAKTLRVRGIDAFGYDGRDHPFVDARVAVATTGGMAWTPLEPEKWDIVLVLDAAHGISDEKRWHLSHFARARTYGLLSLERHLSPYEDDLVRCLFGFQECTLPQHGLRMRHMEVAWAPLGARRPACRSRGSPRNEVTVKRHRVWKNEPRNRLIARLARSFRAGEDLTPLIANWRDRNWATERPSVFVIAEGLDHALALANKLPGWSILCSGAPNLSGLSDLQIQDITDRTSVIDSVQPFGIVTHGGMQDSQMPWARADVIIRADGGTDMLPLPGNALVESGGSRRPLMLVDIEDRLDVELEHRLRKRFDTYCRAGIFPEGINPASYRVQQFMSRTGNCKKAGRA